jgi:nitroreductase
MKVYDVILSRRTIRKFRQKPVELSILKKLVNAGRLAPSAGNMQPLEYFIARDGKLKEKIFPHIKWARYIAPEGNPEKNEKPAAYIIILVNKDIYLPAYYQYDVGAGAQNITLAALEEGIGCCWIGSFNRKKIEGILKIPQKYSADLVLALGYPKESPECFDIDKGETIKYHKDSSGIIHVPKRKLEDIIHIDHF